jgi:hypothetical protein
MITALETLKMKNIALTPTEKRLLISELTVDEKIYLGNLMLADELNIESDVKELDPESDLQYNKTTYQDGLEVFISNKE